jgi:predicted GNAT family N-acyltransferase
MNNITFKIIKHDTPEYKAAISLGEKILRKPLGLVFSTEELEKEKNYIQIAGFKNKEIVASLSLVSEDIDCKMRRVVVKADFQNTGIGSQMIKFCETYAKSMGFKSIYCHARDSAIQFYQKNHYISEGDYFNEDTIPHLKMRIYL